MWGKLFAPVVKDVGGSHLNPTLCLLLAQGRFSEFLAQEGEKTHQHL